MTEQACEFCRMPLDGVSCCPAAQFKAEAQRLRAIIDVALTGFGRFNPCDGECTHFDCRAVRALRSAG